MSVVHLRSPVGTYGPSRRSVGSRVRRAALGVFFTSISVNAALGIYALVAPEFGDTQSKLLASSLCVTGAILVALACEPAWERGLLGPVPYAGAIAGAIGFGMAVGGIWFEPDSATYGKAMGSILDVAGACTIASLLALARLAKRHEWVFVVATALLALGAAMFAVMPWLGDDPPEVLLRTMGVVYVAFAALAVTVPVLHWVDRSARAKADASDAVRYCPHCGKPVAGEPGSPIRCDRCARAFLVTRAGGGAGVH